MHPMGIVQFLKDKVVMTVLPPVLVLGAIALGVALFLQAGRSVDSWFSPKVSTVDRAWIVGCLEVTHYDGMAVIDKAERLESMRCDRFSDAQYARIEAEERACANLKNWEDRLPCHLRVEGYSPSLRQ